MPAIMTSRFGELSYEENEIITFTQGLLGFDEWLRYVIVHPQADVPLQYLQCLEDGDLAFIITDPFLFFADYDFELPDEEREVLGLSSHEHVTVRAILTVKDDIRLATANLLAPIIINTEKRWAKQVVLHHTEYKTRHSLAKSGAGSIDNQEGK